MPKLLVTYGKLKVCECRCKLVCFHVGNIPHYIVSPIE